MGPSGSSPCSRTFEDLIACISQVCAERAVTDARVLQWRRLQRILFGLDDKPSFVSDGCKSTDDRCEVNRAVPGHGVHTLQYGVKKGVGAPRELLQHGTAHILGMHMNDPAPMLLEHGHGICACEDEVSGVEEQVNGLSRRRHEAIDVMFA